MQFDPSRPMTRSAILEMNPEVMDRAKFANRKKLIWNSVNIVPELSQEEDNLRQYWSQYVDNVVVRGSDIEIFEVNRGCKGQRDLKEARRPVHFKPAWGTQLIFRDGNTAKLAFDPPIPTAPDDTEQSDDCTIEMLEA